MRGEGSAASRVRRCVEERFATVTLDAGRGLGLRQDPADDAAHDRAQWRGRWGSRCHRLSAGRRLGVRLLAGDVDRASECAHDVDQRLFVRRRGDRFERLVALDRGQRVSPHQSLVEPVPEGLTDAEPIGHSLDDEPVGDPRCRGPAIQEVERFVEQVVGFDRHREPRSDRDDIGPIAWTRSPGRVEDHAQAPGQRRRCVRGRCHEGQSSPAIEHGKRWSRAGSDWLGGSLYRTRMPSCRMPA